MNIHVCEESVSESTGPSWPTATTPAAQNAPFYLCRNPVNQIERETRLARMKYTSRTEQPSYRLRTAESKSSNRGNDSVFTQSLLCQSRHRAKHLLKTSTA